MSKPAMVLSVFAATMLATLAWVFMLHRPTPVYEPKAQRIDCLSYAPFRLHGETPFDPSFRVTEERIEIDLRALQTRTDCVRTYSVDQGLDRVPVVAERLGMRVMLGLWIGRKDVENRAEIDRALAVIDAHPRSIASIVVGNEVLLRREQTPQALAAYLELVNAKTDIPVTYADVWEFWVRNVPLAAQVDFVTAHILPYWEDHPVSSGDAMAHVLDIYREVSATFAPKQVVVGETGWPSAGRMRGPADPGRVAQAAFVREWVDRAAENGIHYNLIEGFDQPWKRRLEGAMGGAWGILGSDAQPRWPWHGPVAERDGAAWLVLVYALLGAIAAVTVFRILLRYRGSRDRGVNAPAIAVSAFAGATLGALLPEQWHYLVTWSRTPIEWAAGGGFALIAAAFTLLLPTWLALSESRTGNDESAGAARIERWMRWLRLIVLFGAALMASLHAFDARYRGFPTVLYLLPAVGLLCAWLAGRRLPASAVEERLFGFVILLALPSALWGEVPANHDAIVFFALLAAIAVSCVGGSGASEQARNGVRIGTTGREVRQV